VAQPQQGPRAGQGASDCPAGHCHFIPDFRAEPIEHATNGDVMFVRWIARGTGPKEPFEAVGVDRLIVPNGYVAENLILSDHPIFADFARYVGDLRGA